MCKGTWVCFKCRTAVRRDTWRLITYVRPELVGDTMKGGVRCPHCRTACQFIGPSIAIPPKRGVASWRRLQADVTRFRQTVAAGLHKSAIRKKHDLEQRIRDLKSRPANSGRALLLKELEKELSDA